MAIYQVETATRATEGTPQITHTDMGQITGTVGTSMTDTIQEVMDLRLSRAFKLGEG